VRKEANLATGEWPDTGPPACQVRMKTSAKLRRARRDSTCLSPTNTMINNAKFENLRLLEGIKISKLKTQTSISKTQTRYF
jgi:hypothetical protein